MMIYVVFFKESRCFIRADIKLVISGDYNRSIIGRSYEKQLINHPNNMAENSTTDFVDLKRNEVCYVYIYSHIPVTKREVRVKTQ